VKLPALQPTERRRLSAEDLQRLAEAIPDGYKALIYVGGVLGLRFGECAALRVRSLDTLRTSLTVTESLGEVQGRIVIGPPKSAASRRTMLVPAPLMQMLSAELARRGITGADPDAFVFAAPQGGPLRYAAFRSRVWLPATRTCGLDGLGFHDLRRASATAMVALGVDVRTAQSRLGHSDPRTTLGLYAQATRAGDRTAADRLGAHFMADAESPESDTDQCGDPT
jgi:integrase